MSERPRRRWFRFSLRTLFLLMTVVGCALGWTVYSLGWIKQRKQALVAAGAWSVPGRQPVVSAPAMLHLFGEKGYHKLVVPFEPRDPPLLTPAEEEQYERLQRLFPEAWVTFSILPSGF